MTSYSDAILEDWRRWLYMDGFLRARELDHPALVTNMMGTLRWFVDHELYLQTGRFGGSKMPGMGGEGCPFDVDEAAREASALRASITVSGPYGDILSSLARGRRSVGRSLPKPAACRAVKSLFAIIPRIRS